MELYTYKLTGGSPTLPGDFDIQEVVEDYESLIWTERYYGDSECEVVLPLNLALLDKFPLNTFLGIADSEELLILETITIEENRINLKAISILSWLNNRFIRYSKKHKKQEKTFKGYPPGQLLWQLLFDMVSPSSSVLLDPDSMGIASQFLTKLPIPEIGLYNFDSSDDPITWSVAYANLFDEMSKIATAYQIGMKIFLNTKLDPDLSGIPEPLVFRSYKGINRTRTQDSSGPQNDIVQFSPDLDSLDNYRQLMSQSIYKTIAFSFASDLDYELSTLVEHGTSGVAYPEGMGDANTFRGFNCRAMQVFDSDYTQVPFITLPSDDDVTEMFDVLNGFAKEALEQAVLVEAVDGDITPNNMFQYGRDYTLGDLVEVRGSNGVYSAIRVTEHIISEDATGEKGYVTTGDPTQVDV